MNTEESEDHEAPSALARALQRAEEAPPDTQSVHFDSATITRLCRKARGVFLKHLAKGHAGSETLLMLAAMLRIVELNDGVGREEVDRIMNGIRNILENFIHPNPKGQQANN